MILQNFLRILNEEISAFDRNIFNIAVKTAFYRSRAAFCGNNRREKPFFSGLWGTFSELQWIKSVLSKVHSTFSEEQMGKEISGKASTLWANWIFAVNFLQCCRYWIPRVQRNDSGERCFWEQHQSLDFFSGNSPILFHSVVKFAFSLSKDTNRGNGFEKEFMNSKDFFG